MKLLYCVIHTELQKEREQFILSTWGKDKNLIFYGDYDSPTNPSLVKVSSNCTYSSGEEKQINIIPRLVQDFCDYDWYYFCDNDTFVNTKLLEEFYLECDPDKIYGELGNTWPEDRELFYPMGGAGFLMSNKVLRFLSDKIFHNPVTWGDVSIGINFRKFNIEKVSREDLFHSQLPDFYNIPLEEVGQHISFHYVKDLQTMQKLHEKCQ